MGLSQSVDLSFVWYIDADTYSMATRYLEQPNIPAQIIDQISRNRSSPRGSTTCAPVRPLALATGVRYAPTSLF